MAVLRIILIFFSAIASLLLSDWVIRIFPFDIYPDEINFETRVLWIVLNLIIHSCFLSNELNKSLSRARIFTINLCVATILWLAYIIFDITRFIIYSSRGHFGESDTLMYYAILQGAIFGFFGFLLSNIYTKVFRKLEFKRALFLLLVFGLILLGFTLLG